MLEIFKIKIKDLTEDEYKFGLSMMEENKKARVCRMSIDDNRRRSIAGDLLARRSISKLCSIDVEDIVFSVREDGKPIAISPEVCFNIGHSGDLSVCAVSDVQVGIDVERIRPVSARVMRRVCCDEEFGALFPKGAPASLSMVINDVDVLERFFAFWTAKEAHFKCSGEGIRQSMCGYNTLAAEDISYSKVFDGYFITVCGGK